MILFQEQVINLFCSFGGVSPWVGYRFVKAAAKGKIDKFPEYADRFLESAAKAAGIDAAVGLYEQLRKAGRYACCQAHHLANAMTTYQAAFSKVHYPSEFAEAVRQIPAAA